MPNQQSALAKGSPITNGNGRAAALAEWQAASPRRILLRKDILSLTGFSSSTLARAVYEQSFPHPTNLRSKSGKTGLSCWPIEAYTGWRTQRFGPALPLTLGNGKRSQNALNPTAKQRRNAAISHLVTSTGLILNRQDILELTGLSTSTLARMIQEGDFPKPRTLKAPGNAIAWPAEVFDVWRKSLFQDRYFDWTSES